jgi:hypothetical protein
MKERYIEREKERGRERKKEREVKCVINFESFQ